MALPDAARGLTRRWRGMPGDGTAHDPPRRASWAALATALALILASGLLAGCATYKGSLTYLDSVDLYPVGNWSPFPLRNQAGLGNGIYLMPDKHLILVHIDIPSDIATLGPGALHGAVGVWWLALDDRVPRDSTPQWRPDCDRFKTGAKGAAFDLAGNYLDGPASANLSRYPLAINPEDSSISVALSPADEIHLPRTSGTSAPLAPAAGSCLSP
jgi:hypothetical protein